MRKFASLAVAAIALQLGASLVLADNPYYPYQTYEEYYKAHSVGAPAEQTRPAPPPAPEVKPPAHREPPLTVTAPPDFLFPPVLGFGVAVGVPYDLFYVGKEYYTVRRGAWYRSDSYRGPWTLVGASKVPRELQKEPLYKIHEIRNREFAEYWKDRKNYKGKRFSPGEERKAPAKPAAQKK